MMIGFLWAWLALGLASSTTAEPLSPAPYVPSDCASLPAPYSQYTILATGPDGTACSSVQGVPPGSHCTACCLSGDDYCKDTCNSYFLGTGDTGGGQYWWCEPSWAPTLPTPVPTPLSTPLPTPALTPIKTWAQLASKSKTSGTYNLSGKSFSMEGYSGDEIEIVSGTAVAIHGAGAVLDCHDCGTSQKGRFFDVDQGGSLSLVNITLQHAGYNDGSHGGGAIVNKGTLTATTCQFLSNKAYNAGAAQFATRAP